MHGECLHTVPVAVGVAWGGQTTDREGRWERFRKSKKWRENKKIKKIKKGERKEWRREMAKMIEKLEIRGKWHDDLENFFSYTSPHTIKGGQ